MRAMLLTAGEGRRLRPLTEELPKPRLSFFGIPLLAYPLELLLENGTTDLVLNTYHLPEKIHQLAPILESKVRSLEFSKEEQLMGTGGGLKMATAFLEQESDFIYINGDELILPQKPHLIGSLIKEHRRTGALATLLVTEHPEVGHRFGGIWSEVQGRVALVSKTDPQNKPGYLSDGPLKGWHYLGAMVAKRELLEKIPADQPCDILYDVLNPLMTTELVRIYPAPVRWFETGDPHSFYQAFQSCAFLEEHIPEKQFLQRVWQNWGADFTCFKKNESNMVYGAKDFVTDHFDFKGINWLEPGCSIPEGSQIDHSMILSPESFTAPLELHSELLLQRQRVRHSLQKQKPTEI